MPPPLLVSPGSKGNNNSGGGGNNAGAEAPNAASNSAVEGLVSKHLFPEELDRAVDSVRREEHEKRIKELRKELDYLNDTAWKFQKGDGSHQQF